VSRTCHTEIVTLRDLRRDDAEVLDVIVAGLSPHSRYLRFHSPIPTLSAGMRRALLDVDGHDRIAVVAETRDGTPVGIARMFRDPQRPDEAELAVAVVDAWHRRGVGRRLVTAVVERATAAGVRRLTARVLDENVAARGLFRALFPVTFTRRDDDALVLVALLGGPDGTDWTITIDDILADLAR
jgi:RimJ/RimL family protein N-acetyltransferase